MRDTKRMAEKRIDTKKKEVERGDTHFVHGGVYSAVLYIVQDGVVEQYSILRNYTNALYS